MDNKEFFEKVAKMLRSRGDARIQKAINIANRWQGKEVKKQKH